MIGVVIWSAVALLINMFFLLAYLYKKLILRFKVLLFFEVTFIGSFLMALNENPFFSAPIEAYINMYGSSGVILYFISPLVIETVIYGLWQSSKKIKFK